MFLGVFVSVRLSRKIDSGEGTCNGSIAFCQLRTYQKKKSEASKSIMVPVDGAKVYPWSDPSYTIVPDFWNLDQRHHAGAETWLVDKTDVLSRQTQGTHVREHTRDAHTAGYKPPDLQSEDRLVSASSTSTICMPKIRFGAISCRCECHFHYTTTAIFHYNPLHDNDLQGEGIGNAADHTCHNRQIQQTDPRS